MSDDPNRCTGRTTRQMLAAPQGAVFITRTPCNAQWLADKVNRFDLYFVAPLWLTNERWLGLTFTGIVVDHDVRLTEREQEMLRQALTRVRKRT